MENRVCASVFVHDDTQFLSAVLAKLDCIPRYVFVSKLNWQGGVGDWKSAQRIAKAAGAEVVLGEWTSEIEHRKAAYDHCRSIGFAYALIPDSDEIIEPELLSHLLNIAETGLADRVYVEWDTYWSTVEYVIRPREPFRPCIMINLDVAETVRLRDFEGGRALFLNEGYGIIHHLSYVGDDERIGRKVSTWSHKNEVVPHWWEGSWKAWHRDRLIKQLHPTHPENYAFAERIEVPAILADLAPKNRKDETPTYDVDPQFSVCIPLYGGGDFLPMTLTALEKCRDLLHEVIVVDNASPDDAWQLVAEHDWIKLIRNDQNEGFARASNQGYRACTGKTILFLNSDAIVTRHGLVELANSLYSSGTVAAAAPMTNFACTEQYIQPCLSSLENLDRFAADMADRTIQDTDTDFAIGFCFAVKSAVLEELGPFDERFNIGGSEDTELCYRVRRAGYRILVAQKSYIHHVGSQTFSRMAKEMDVHGIMQVNDRKFWQKWQGDLNCGFASHLSGQSKDRIRFDESKRPKPKDKEIARLAKEARISLCMIVRDEERVIRECLESAKPYFMEMLVLDTGSVDRTREIAAECGAVVKRTKWQDSFSKARNASMKGAKGEWIMWIDADDTIPAECGEQILRAVASAPPHIIGFVVPVQFVESRGDGTMVDHVKVFRNLPGLEWTLRIHEQIVGSLRQCASKAGIPDGGEIARLRAYVLHSGYDTSPEGQAKKKVRDDTLCIKDVEEQPDNPFPKFNMGMTLHFRDEHEGAVQWFRKSIAQAVPSESQVRKAYALMGASLRALGKVDDAKVALEEGLAAAPGDPEITFYLAQIAAAAGNHERAVELYRKVLSADISGIFSSIDPGILGYKTRHNLALSFLAMKDYPAAREQLGLSLQADPRPETALTFFEAALAHSDLAMAKEMLIWNRTNFGYDANWAFMVSRLSEATGLDPSPHFDTVLQLQPANLEVRTALARYLLNSNQKEAAVRQFDYLQARGVAEGAFFLGVLAEESGDLRKALGWYEHAHTLNPAHADTLAQVARLRAILSL